MASDKAMIGVWLRWLCLALVAFGCATIPAHAQAGVAGQPIDVCVMRDTGQDAARLVRRPAGFDCTTPQHRFGSGDFWAVTRDIDLRSTFNTPLALRFASLWQRGLSIHILYADGSIRNWHSDARGITPLLQLGAIAQLPLPPRDPAVVRVLFHVQGAANARAIVTGVRVGPLHDGVTANLRLAALYAGFAGIAIALIVYNFALWCAMRHRFQLHYCVLLTALLGYTASSSGVLAWFAPAMANNDRLRLNYLFVGLAGGAAALFTRSFFEQRTMPPWLDRTVLVLAAMLPLSSLTVALFGAVDLRLADLFYTATVAALIAIVVPVILGAWRRRSPFLWLFALAWSAPIVLTLVRVMAALHLLPWNFWIDNSTIIAMVFEAQVSALAVAYRIKALRDERDDAILREVLTRRLADTDPLTGLLNRRAFLAEALGRAGEQRLLLIDIDHFKRINDTIGHDGGDDVLRLFARALRSAAPDALIARMGGEEFALVASAAQSIEPDALLARLRTARMPFDLKVTASIGASAGPLTDLAEWKALYRAADAALFEAKAAGRDRARGSLESAA
ncbi:sensor domain-containing diguanylate cyclase [Sphingomonas sp. RS6]